MAASGSAGAADRFEVTARRLAIDGGTPAFTRPRLTGAPNDIDREAVYRRLDAMFDRHRLTNNGPLVREFEDAIGGIVGVDNVVAVGNGTLALLIGAVGLGATGDVLVPSWTFAGTVQPLVWAGLRPRFVEVAPLTHSLDPASLAAALDDAVGLVVPVHLWGRPCEIGTIDSLAAQAGVPVLFDAAHAFGSTHGGVAVGNFGSAEIFSFHATKWMTSIEGGALTTSDDDLADHCRRLRNFGFAGEGDIPVSGINAKMSEMHAAVGLTQLERFDAIRAINRERYEAYTTALAGHPAVRVAPVANAGSSPHGYVVIEVEADHPEPARALQTILDAENVRTRRYFAPGVHKLGAFASADTASLPVTESLAQRCLSLPTGESISTDDAVTIAGLVLRGLERISGDAEIRLDVPSGVGTPV